jgi:hypothetical protein
MRKLSLDDIVDLRAYERERETFRAEIIALKRRRRVGVGPVVTLVFENRDTIRFQIQEMARAERMLADDAIELELAAYNPLIPEPGHLSATLFLELTSEDELRHWLPRLVGIERSVQLHLGNTVGPLVVTALPEADHASRLTRHDVTASVHYVHFSLTQSEIAAFSAGPVRLAIDHPEYRYSTALSAETGEELLTDLLADA